MRTTHRSRLSRLVRRRRRGQSIPIIALMLLVLVAMVGLSVDVGNTFSHERQAVSASNAAAIAGMSAYIEGKSNSNLTDNYVYSAIQKSVESNGLTVGDGTDGTVNLQAYYLDSQGNLLSGHAVIDPNGSNSVPPNVAYLQVLVNGKVDTSFARVVGRPDLPINASAHAGLCPANSGVYPIAVDNTILTGNEFNNTNATATEYQRLKTGKYAGYVQRRVYVKDTAAGNFSWLRWMETKGANGQSATSAGELTASVTGVGNISSGFEEAPWPSDLANLKPAGYPLEPSTLGVGDWVWGTPGWKSGNPTDAAIDQHIANQTMMVLPIYSDILGTGSNTEVHVVNLGAFVITARGTAPGNGAYFDMIYFGEPVRQETACTVTPPPAASSNLTLFGNVSFYPEYQILPSTRQPIQYVVVLDESGSMSANFNGQCNNTGSLIQCANGPPGAPAVTVSGTGPTYNWSNQSERRIYVAKKALERLVGLTNMPGNAGYDTTRPDDQMAVVWFIDNVQSGNSKAFSNAPSAITTFITNANKTGGSSYLTSGGTNGAAGLYQASRLYKTAPTSITYAGKDWPYKRVVLYISDGVSNTFLDTNAANLSGGSSSSGTYTKNSTCNKLGTFVTEDASCQTTDTGGIYKGWDRPITQMVNTSSTYLRNQTTNAQVFVIALSNIPSTGLKDGVASSSSYFFSAESLTKNADGTTNVDKIIDTINTKVELGNCLPGADGANRASIPSTQFVNGAAGVPFNYPQVGEVVITSDTDSFTAPITADSNGRLTYEFTNVPPNTYTLEAYLFYHHPLDPPNVMRQYKKIWAGDNGQDNISVDVSPSTQATTFNNERKQQDLTLHLNGDVCAS